MNTQLIELRKEAVHPSVTVQMRLAAMTAADALEAQELRIREQASEIERLNHEDKLITKWTENGELIERLYSAGLEQEREITALRAELAALRAGGQEGVSKSDLVYLYAVGYKSGHHDTVEGRYTDVTHHDARTYHEDVVDTIISEGEIAQPVQPSQAQPDETLTYKSSQATTCAGCLQHKHTPLRIDAMGGYVCLTCIDQKLGSLLGEFGCPDAQPSQARDHLREVDFAGMIKAFERVIEAQFSSDNPFHQPINSDAMMALRILKGVIPLIAVINAKGAV